jgi:hypothetical protein
MYYNSFECFLVLNKTSIFGCKKIKTFVFVCQVAKVFTVAIETLCDPEHCHYTYFRKGSRGSGFPFSMPVYTSGDQRIWGLTAIITHLTLKLVVPNSIDLIRTEY